MAQNKGKAAKPAEKSPKKTVPTKVEDKRVYFKQADFPQTTLQQAQRIASAIVDNFVSLALPVSKPQNFAMILE